MVIEFDKNNLTKEELKIALDNLKTAIIHYEKMFKSKKIYFNNVSDNYFTITDSSLVHILGIDALTNCTWYDYIVKNIKNVDDLKKISNSLEFIEYNVFKKNEQPILNFRKIIFKTNNFCKLNLDTSDYFFFKINHQLHIGKIIDEKLITIKLSINKVQNIYIPTSLYVYDLTDKELRSMYDIIIPIDMKIKQRKKPMIITKTNTDDVKQKVLEITKKK